VIVTPSFIKIFQFEFEEDEDEEEQRKHRNLVKLHAVCLHLQQINREDNSNALMKLSQTLLE
jgi:hypothetical protein